jgi:hypothetical protein
MSKLKKNFPFFLSFALIFIVFWLSAANSLDPDFGWHIQMGRIIQKGGVPPTDPFSYTMPSFAFVDNGWLTSWLLGFLFEKIGYFALAFVFSLLAICALLLSLNIKLPIKNVPVGQGAMYTKLMLLFLTGAVIYPFFGVRPQVFSWLCFSLLFSVLFISPYWNKFKYFLPMLFVAWVNLHGSFAAGLAVLFFVVLARVVRQRRIIKTDIVILLLSSAATFISPYGSRAWGEVLLQISDNNLRWTISEWMPSFLVFSPQLIVLAVLSFLLIFRYRRVFGFEAVSVYFLLLVQAVLSRRHIPIWALFGLPITFGGLGLISKEAAAIKYGSQRFKKFLGFGFLAALVIFFAEFGIFLIKGSDLGEQNFYPKEAVAHLSSNVPSGNLFSDYGWGGYLIWKLPEKKVFIDGRMPSWRWEAGIPQEENYVMKVYTQILNGDRDFRPVFQKYNVGTVLWPKGEKNSFLKDLDKKFMPLLQKFGWDRKDFDFVEELKKDGWKVVYEDEVSVVYQKP